ncbi:MAG: TetR/AcrR family transcriptional regulator, partial [Dehalococcoidia bacterium]
SARAVFAASNYWKVSTADLAHAAGISEPALYRHFSGKKDIFLSTLKDTAPRLLDAWQRIAADIDDPIETLWTIGLNYYDHVKSRSAVTKLQFQALIEADDPDIQAALHRNFVSFLLFLTDVLDDGKRHGIVRPDLDSEVFAWQFLGLGLTLDVSYLLGFGRDVSRQKFEARMWLFLDAIRSPQAAGGSPRVAAASLHEHIPAAPPPLEGIPS